MIRLTIPAIDDAEISAASEVLRSGYLVQGKCVAAFEESLARMVGVKHAVAVSSGTAALHVALAAAGVGPGDCVVTTAYSWPATANVIELCGARPVFVDICRASYNLDCNELEDACRDGDARRHSLGRPKAILPVHAFGQPADMTAINEIAGRFGLTVIEDAACALGSRWDGRAAGAWGCLGCFSFHPRKSVTTGEGGAVTTDDDALANALRALRNHGLDPTASRSEFILPGYNYRLTEIGAAIGRVQLGKLPSLTEARRSRADDYTRLLSGTTVTAPAVSPNAVPNWQSYVALLPEAAAGDRAQIVASLHRAGIEATIGTWHIPMTQYYRTRYGYREGDFPVSDDVFRRTITLPLHHRLTADEQRTVVETLIALVNLTTVPCLSGTEVAQ